MPPQTPCLPTNEARANEDPLLTNVPPQDPILGEATLGEVIQLLCQEMMDLLCLLLQERIQPMAPLLLVTEPASFMQESTLAKPPREGELCIITLEWDGSHNELENFLNQCELNFTMNLSKFPTEGHKVLFAVGNLMEIPHMQICNLWQSWEPILWMSNWDTFCKGLRWVSRDLDPGYTTHIQLLHLKQQGLVANHATKFLLLTSKAHTTDKDQMVALFKCSLSNHLHEQLVNQCTSSIKEFINESIWVEQQMKLIWETGTSLPMRLPSTTWHPVLPPLPPSHWSRWRSAKQSTTQNTPLFPCAIPPGKPQSASTNIDEPTNQCYGCGGDHLVWDCTKALQMATLCINMSGLGTNIECDDWFGYAGLPTRVRNQV